MRPNINGQTSLVASALVRCTPRTYGDSRTENILRRSIQDADWSLSPTVRLPLAQNVFIRARFYINPASSDYGFRRDQNAEIWTPW